MEASTQWLWIRRFSWMLFAVALLLFLTVGQPFVQRLLSGEQLRDFAQEWTSSRNYFTGFPIYEKQEKTFAYHLGHVRKKDEYILEYNAHPPTSVLLSLPFAALDYTTAFRLWTILSLAALGLTIYLLARELRIPLDRWSIFPISSLILLCAFVGPLRPQLEEGQWNLFLLLLLTGVWKCARSDRLMLAGLLLGLATAVKLFPGLLFIPFLVQRKWRLAGWGIVSFLTATMLTVVVLGLDTYRTYIFDVIPHLERYRSVWFGMSFKGFWSKLFDPIPIGGVTVPLLESPWLARSLTILSSGLLILALVRASWRTRSQQEQDDVFALTMVAMLLVSPIAWDNYLLLLLLPLMYFWATMPKTGWPTWMFRGLAVMLSLRSYCYWCLILCDPRQDWCKCTAQPWQTLTALSVHTYALLGLFVFGLATFGGRALIPARRWRAGGVSPLILAPGRVRQNQGADAPRSPIPCEFLPTHS
jgi:Glycosyltransferase family 87